MIQRVLEPSELIEAELTGEAVLPTIFSLTSPFAEPFAVGLTEGIIGGHKPLPVSLKDEAENCTKPLRSIPPSEMIVAVLREGLDCSLNMVITVDLSKRQLSIWRYAYLKPKDIPTPLRRSTVPNMAEAKKRHSMPAPGSRRTSAVYDSSGRFRPPLSPGMRSREGSPAPDIFEPLPNMPPLSALPSMAPAISTTTTLQSLVSAGTSQRSAGTNTRRHSVPRNELSMTVDRMGFSRTEPDIELPAESGRMKAAYWMERVYTEVISEDE
jgi:anaphase-promoting complex subunit 1